jgi:hypothetical protein
MQRSAEGWKLEIVAFGAKRVRADDRIATIPGLKELRNVPLTRADWTRREFGLFLDAKGGHEQLPIEIVVLAYATTADKDDFIPDVASADGVLFLESGDLGLDTRVGAAVDVALAERVGKPPHIVERVKGDDVKTALRTIVKRTVHALKTGKLNGFWKESVSKTTAARDAAVFGALTKEKILGQPPGELVPFLLRVVRDRGRRAVASGRLPSSEAFDRSLSARWQRLLAVKQLEMLVGDDGIAALFAAPGARPMEREEVTAALAGLKRIGASQKAQIIERALMIAREAELWEGKTNPTAKKVLEELSSRFYDVKDEQLSTRLEEDIRKAPDEFTLGAYED